MTAGKSFNLPWHQHEHFWLCVYPRTSGFAASTLDALQKAGMQKLDNDGFGLRTPRQWKPVWDKLYAALTELNAVDQVEISLTFGETLPVGRPERQAPARIDAVAQSMWLGDALLEGRIMCYLQPVVSAKNKVFGYESFARVKGENGNIIAGHEIIAASKTLGIEYVIDRHLQVQAIRTFASSAFNGFLFVNFFPGFIHRPSVYLEGLGDTAKSFGMVAKHVVLDFTKSETPRDLSHLKSVCEYGRSKGYSIALDDIESIEGASKLIGEVHPDFVKLDMQLCRRASEPAARDTIRQIVDLAHGNSGTVIGEGIETDDVHQALKSLGVDLFQGYLFSPPVPVEAALKRSTA